jgi:hypothetical protein
MSEHIRSVLRSVHDRIALNLIWVSALVLVASCGPSSVVCGPLDGTACAARTTEIAAVVSRNFPGRHVSSIAIVNAAGDAHVVLDDGSKVGFGRARVTRGRVI